MKLPKCLEGSHITYDKSINNSRMQHRSSSNSRNRPGSTHDTREGSSQKCMNATRIEDTPSPVSRSPFTSPPCVWMTVENFRKTTVRDDFADQHGGASTRFGMSIAMDADDEEVDAAASSVGASVVGVAGPL